MIRISHSLTGALALGAVLSTYGADINPTAGAWTDLPAATFGGSGIPNDDVGVTTVQNNGNTITLGITAHQRYFNPALASDGNGTFTAGTGSNYGDPLNPATPSPSAFLGSTWNFAFYASIFGTSLTGTDGPLTFWLLVDTDPTVDTDEAAHTPFQLPIFGPVTAAPTTYQESSNLGFLPGFAPDATGEYTFAVVARSGTTEIARSAMRVNVQAVPDGGSSLMLLAGGLSALIGFNKIRNRRS